MKLYIQPRDMQHLTYYHDYSDNRNQKTFQLLHIHYIDQLRADAIITANGRNETRADDDYDRQSHIHQPIYTQRVIMIMTDNHIFTSLYTHTARCGLPQTFSPCNRGP